MFEFQCSLLLLFTSSHCYGLSTKLVSSCTGITDHNWNSEMVADRIESWIRSGVTLPGEGELSLEDAWRNKLLKLKPGDSNHKEEEEHFDDENPIFNVNDKSVVTIGKFVNDLPTGLVWQWRSRRFEDGFLYGYVNKKGKFTGENITHIYPDLKSGFRGTFINGNMMAGVEVKITGERCKSGIKELRIETVEKRKGIIWKKEDLNSTYIGRHPTVRDPYERRGTYIGQSSIPGSGQGVFAKRHFLPGQLVMYLSGLKVNLTDIYRPDMTKEERLIAGSYVFDFGQSFQGLSNYDGAIDIPPEYRDVHNYRTTLGHKVNHNFVETNTEFDFGLHPSHGPVVSLLAIQSIAKDQEIFVNYHYNVEHAPQWYKEQFENIKFENIYKGGSDELSVIIELLMKAGSGRLKWLTN